jgi:general L-amino acid transport system substrate-binding protein
MTMKHLLGGLVLGAVATLAQADIASAGATFDAVKARGVVHCGVNTGLSGFSMPDSAGAWKGIDVDLCRAIAAAMYGDASKTRFTAYTAQQRFTALQSGEIDVLLRNTTITISRDSVLGLNYTGINFYDGQAFIVAKKLNVAGLKDLAGATICMATGTTHELTISDWFRARNLQFKPLVIENQESMYQAFFAGRCDAMTQDSSALAAAKASRAGNPDDYVILPDRISKEPLGPLVRHGDDQWFDLVKWTLMAMLEAEELGVNQANVDEMLKSANPEIQRLLGVTGNFGGGLGVDNKWVYTIVKQVGNYADSFERNVGKGSPLKLERGPNDLWTKGGLMYAIPFR